MNLDDYIRLIDEYHPFPKDNASHPYQRYKYAQQLWRKGYTREQAIVQLIWDKRRGRRLSGVPAPKPVKSWARRLRPLGFLWFLLVIWMVLNLLNFE